MIIKIDCRENDLIQKISNLITTIPIFKNIQIETGNLPIGDVIIYNDLKEEKLIIERKTYSDLVASIKDGRYEEQSLRLNGLPIHNHNIIYLIEGNIDSKNRFKMDNQINFLTIYSAMFSLNYYKGFSVFRSLSIDESATILCNISYKLEKELKSGKSSFYLNKGEEKEKDKIDENLENLIEKDEKEYSSVIKRVKKDNITPENIGEIMLSQIPGISSTSAITIMNKYQNINNLIKELEKDENCLKDISTINAKGQIRKINKTSIANIVKFLVKK